VYPSIDDTKKAFKTFFDKIPANGLLVLNGNSGPLRQINIQDKRIIWYGLTPNNNDWWIENSFTGESKQMVKIVSRQGESYQFTLSVPGILTPPTP
jgi:UDP-N-acetylmuramate-alanine ligase